LVVYKYNLLGNHVVRYERGTSTGGAKHENEEKIDGRAEIKINNNDFVWKVIERNSVTVAVSI
jgi:hypothetical protein